jgi:hypothetical protein
MILVPLKLQAFTRQELFEWAWIRIINMVPEIYRKIYVAYIVTIQVTWNIEKQQFEGKYYLRTDKHRDEHNFIIRFQTTKHFRPYTNEF